MRRPRKLASLMLLQTIAGTAAVGPLLAGVPVALGAPALEKREGKKECQGVPGCQTVQTRVQTLRAGKPTRVELACPAGTYFWNWSATVAQFVQVSLVDTRLDRKRHEVAATFEYYAQTGNGPGLAQVYLGCSRTPISAGKLRLRRLAYGWNPHQGI